MTKYFLIIFSVILFSCKDANKANEAFPAETISENSYSEPFRPQFHFTPQEKWMNDPNGLVYNDGVYHLFYQYYPEEIGEHQSKWK